MVRVLAGLVVAVVMCCCPTAAFASRLSRDEAKIAADIKLLSDPSNEVRGRAAAELRGIIARYPGGTTNIRYRDGGKGYWERTCRRIKLDFIKSDVLRAVPPFKDFPELGLLDSGALSYRLDYDWVVSVPLNDDIQVSQPPTVEKKELAIELWVPPDGYSGSWISWYCTGQKESDEYYKNGRETGTLTHFYTNGHRAYITPYVNGVPEGKGMGWFPDGHEQFEAYYRQGFRNGKFEHWYDDGQKRGESNWIKGMPDGFSRGWYENGQLEFQVQLENGRENGVADWWFESGQKNKEVAYSNGKENGLMVWWFESGQKQADSHYKDGVKQGEETLWDEAGNVVARREYDDGALVEPGGNRAMRTGNLLLQWLRKQYQDALK